MRIVTYFMQVFSGAFFCAGAVLWWMAISHHLVFLMWANVAVMGVNGALFIAQFHIRDRLPKRV